MVSRREMPPGGGPIETFEDAFLCGAGRDEVALFKHNVRLSRSDDRLRERADAVPVAIATECTS